MFASIIVAMHLVLDVCNTVGTSICIALHLG